MRKMQKNIFLACINAKEGIGHLKRIWRFINGSIKYRLLCYMILISILPLLILQIANIMVSNSAVKNVLVESAEVEVENALYNIERVMANVETVCLSIENNISFQQRMRTTYSSMAERYSVELEASMDLASLISPYTDIYGIYVLGNNQLCCKSTMDAFTKTDYRNDEWFKWTFDSEKDGWYSIHEDSFVVKTAGKNFFSYVVPYIDKATAQINGVIVVDIEEEAITSLVENGLVQDGFFMFLDEKDEIFYHTYSDYTTEELLDKIICDVRTSKNKMDQKEFVTLISDSNMILVYQKAITTGWTLVGIIPENYLNCLLSNIIYMMIAAVVLISILAVVFSSVLAKRFTEPVIDIKKAMKRVEKGELSVQIEIKGNDEIAELAKRFNHMVIQIQKMTNSIYEKQELLRKSEFKALQAQINPHFLYNSLDSIVWLLRMERTDEAIMILQNLTVLFRIMLSKGHEVIPIHKEIRHLESYLIIQSMRYSRKFTYSVDIPNEYREFYTLKLILQPLVENSIYHGLSAEQTNVHIHISLKEEKDKLIFYVEDTGVGMTQEELELLRKSIQVEVHKEDVQPSIEKEGGYGLKNVNERIKIYFGDEYGIQVDSQKGKGTVVRVVLPKVEEPEK